MTGQFALCQIQLDGTVRPRPEPYGVGRSEDLEVDIAAEVQVGNARELIDPQCSQEF
ncbi:hypothetical protein QTI24_29760 [Variovorax sp. J22P240]|uniref:hypothetical protein n=1 Tax=Variovorax sp. J22P240 TaxID=3053514 RepID=UPI002574A988|nr:hypothetical protein [Variovorax sp. J22P240]MDM0002810.1 hypothetical protein [Variovorax sp. J22P240]